MQIPRRPDVPTPPRTARTQDSSATRSAQRIGPDPEAPGRPDAPAHRPDPRLLRQTISAAHRTRSRGARTSRRPRAPPGPKTPAPDDQRSASDQIPRRPDVPTPRAPPGPKTPAPDD